MMLEASHGTILVKRFCKIGCSRASLMEKEVEGVGSEAGVEMPLFSTHALKYEIHSTNPSTYFRFDLTI